MRDVLNIQWPFLLSSQPRIRAAFLFLQFMILFALPVRPEAVDISGTWDMTVESQQGTAHPSITVKQEGERIAGTYRGEMGESRLEGTVKGSEISFTVTLKFRDVSYTIAYTGSVTGDNMKGTARFGDAGTGDWSAIRRRNQQ